MLSLPFPLPAQLWPFFMQAIGDLAHHLGGQALKNTLLRSLRANAFEREVTDAIERAYRHFQQTFPDRELLDQFVLDQQLSHNEKVTRLLAEVAATPLYEHDQARRLARELAHVARHAAIERCEAAAKLLIESMHAELAKSRELQDALMMLSNQRLTQALEEQKPLPPYAPGLRESVVAEAKRVATELGQGYVTSAHLVYGLLTPETSTARRVLRHFNVTAEKTRAALDRIIQKYDGIVENPMTEKAEASFVKAQRVARSRLASTTRGEHLLLALLAAADGGPDTSKALTKLFEQLGIPPGLVRDQVFNSIRVESAIRTFSLISGVPPDDH